MNHRINEAQSEPQLVGLIVKALLAEPLKMIGGLAACCYFYGWVVSFSMVISYLQLPSPVFQFHVPHEMRVLLGVIFFLYMVVALLVAECLLWPFHTSVVRKTWTNATKHRLLVRGGIIAGAVAYLYLLVYLVGLSYDISPFLMAVGTYSLVLMAYSPYLRWYIRRVLLSSSIFKATLLFVLATFLLLALPPFQLTALLPPKLPTYTPDKLVLLRTKCPLDETSRLIEGGSYSSYGYLAGESVGGDAFVVIDPNSRRAYLLPKSNVELISAETRMRSQWIRP